jgi:hypothetical protein
VREPRRAAAVVPHLSHSLQRPASVDDAPLRRGLVQGLGLSVLAAVLFGPALALALHLEANERWRAQCEHRRDEIARFRSDEALVALPMTPVAPVPSLAELITSASGTVALPALRPELLWPRAPELPPAPPQIAYDSPPVSSERRAISASIVRSLVEGHAVRWRITSEVPLGQLARLIDVASLAGVRRAHLLVRTGMGVGTLPLDLPPRHASSDGTVEVEGPVPALVIHTTGGVAIETRAGWLGHDCVSATRSFALAVPDFGGGLHREGLLRCLSRLAPTLVRGGHEVLSVESDRGGVTGLFALLAVVREAYGDDALVQFAVPRHGLTEASSIVTSFEVTHRSWLIASTVEQLLHTNDFAIVRCVARAHPEGLPGELGAILGLSFSDDDGRLIAVDIRPPLPGPGELLPESRACLRRVLFGTRLPARFGGEATTVSMTIRSLALPHP